MKTKLIPIIALVALAGAASAQLTGIRARIGYGWSGAVSTGGGSRHLTGPELGVDFPLTHLPLVDVGLTGDVLLGGQLSRGGDLDGSVFRFLLSARAHIPGSQMSAFGGIGWATAQARGGQFASVNGEVLQLGVSFPLGMRTPVLSPSLEVAGTFASKSALSGFSISVGFHF